MNKQFDMEVFLAGVLTGSHATRQRHVRQARIIQAEIAKRWKRATPWTWQRKHLAWFLDQHLTPKSQATRYYYVLTAQLLTRRLEKPWIFMAKKNRRPSGHGPSSGPSPSRHWNHFTTEK